MSIGLVIFAIYIIGLFVISFVVSKKIKDYEDFFVAERKLGLFILMELKRKLADKFSMDREAYTDAKDEFI